MTPHGPYAGVVDVARNGIDEIMRLRRKVQRLQRALYFWLPGVGGAGAMNERIAEDAGLLYGLALPAEPTAEQLGWIKLQGEVL